MDRIILEDIAVEAVIGTLPEERTKRQILHITAELGGDFRAAGKSDDFSLAFDYSAVEKRIFDFVSGSSFRLLEALAENLAEDLLSIPYIASVRLRIDKPGAPKIARRIQIDIERSRGEKTGKKDMSA